MVLKPDQERVKALLKETIVLLCKNGLEFTSEFSIEALVGITIDKDNVFLISIAETVESLAKQLEDEEKAKAEEAAKAEAARIEAEKQQAAARRSPKRRPSHSESPRRHKRQMLASDTGQSYDNNESFSSETYNNYESSNTSGTQDSEYKSSRFKNIKQEVTEDDDDSDLVIVKQEGVTNRDFTNCAPQGGDVNFSSISSAIHAPPDGDMMSQQNYSLQSPSGASQWDMSQAGDPNSQMYGGDPRWFTVRHPHALKSSTGAYKPTCLLDEETLEARRARTRERVRRYREKQKMRLMNNSAPGDHGDGGNSPLSQSNSGGQNTGQGATLNQHNVQNTTVRAQDTNLSVSNIEQNKLDNRSGQNRVVGGQFDQVKKE